MSMVRSTPNTIKNKGIVLRVLSIIPKSDNIASVITNGTYDRPKSANILKMNFKILT